MSNDKTARDLRDRVDAQGTGACDTFIEGYTKSRMEVGAYREGERYETVDWKKQALKATELLTTADERIDQLEREMKQVLEITNAAMTVNQMSQFLIMDDVIAQRRFEYKTVCDMDGCWEDVMNDEDGGGWDFMCFGKEEDEAVFRRRRAREVNDE